MFDDVLSVLTGSSDRAHHEEREQALLDMLHAGGMQYFDREHLVMFYSNSVCIDYSVDLHKNDKTIIWNCGIVSLSSIFY